MQRRLSELPQVLAARFGSVGSAVPDARRGNAAVALILRAPVGCGDRRARQDPFVRQCDFLMIKRAKSARDPWSGQMALPGGRLDAADAGLVHAAIRETREETGVALSAQRNTLGRGEALRPLAIRIPSISIWPFVFRVGGETAARVASEEVAAVHWFPMTALDDPANRGSHLWKHEGMVRRFPCVRVGGEVIWGLTHRVLTRFLAVV